VKRLIVYSEYPDIAGRSTFPKSEKVIFMDKWDDVLKVLEADYPSAANVAVFLTPKCSIRDNFSQNGGYFLGCTKTERKRYYPGHRSKPA